MKIYLNIPECDVLRARKRGVQYDIFEKRFFVDSFKKKLERYSEWLPSTLLAEHKMTAADMLALKKRKHRRPKKNKLRS